MKVTLKLFATLTDFLPAGTKGNQVELDIEDADTVGVLIERFRLPEKLVHLVLINGSYVSPAARLTQQLRDGDQLAIWPPIAGG